MKKGKADKKKKNTIEREIEDAEKWIIERRKFFIRLFLAGLFVLFLFIIGSILDKIN